LEGDSADYERKSSEGIMWGTAYTWKEVEKPCDFPKELFTLWGIIR
jgi:hypothetical protein